MTSNLRDEALRLMEEAIETGQWDVSDSIHEALEMLKGTFDYDGNPQE